MYGIIKEFILPPGNLWLLIVASFVLLYFRLRTAGLALLGLGIVAFYLLATPFVAGRLNAMVQTVPPLSQEAAAASPAQMIVVLSGGMDFDSREYGGPTVDETTLQRVRYAARLHRVTGWPILVSGGRPPGFTASLAGVMKDSLERDFGIKDVTVEGRALDTYQNAAFSAEILTRKNIQSIILVTHASHMPRALKVFLATGLEVVPAPTVFTSTSFDSPVSYIPRLSGLRESHYAIYEMAGQLWYAVRPR